MKSEHKAALAMAIATLFVLISLATSGWVTASEHGGDSVGAGVRSMSMCFDGHCQSQSYAELADHGRHNDDILAILWTGRATLLFALLLLGAAIWSTINVALRKGPQLALTCTMAGVGMLFSLIFVFVVIGVTSKGGAPHMSPGYSFILFFLGAIGLIVSTALAKGTIRRLAGGPSAYGGPLPGYGAPPQNYGAPPQPYGAPPPQYGAPPPQNFAAPPPPYGAPPPQYGAPPPQNFAAPPQSYGAPPAPQAPFCPNDGSPTRWLPDQQRFVCDRCQQLV